MLVEERDSGRHEETAKWAADTAAPLSSRRAQWLAASVSLPSLASTAATSASVAAAALALSLLQQQLPPSLLLQSCCCLYSCSYPSLHEVSPYLLLPYEPSLSLPLPSAGSGLAVAGCSWL